MSEKRICVSIDKLVPFSRDFFGSKDVLTHIGSGSIGGKASGLAFIRDIISTHFKEQKFQDISIDIPRFTVIATDLFDRFMKRNGLYEIAYSDDPDDRIAHAFQNAELPAELVGDLWALISAVHTPLAVRSSSMLEDAMYEPFAGVYATKMIPNNQHDIDQRFHKLVEAIKFVYASIYFKSAKDYIRVTGKSITNEKMAVIIQEVVGLQHNDRFYPDLSGVARSYNYYSMGRAKPEEGVVDLALGLGKAIVDGDLVWSYSPAHPRIAPPVGSPGELLKRSQRDFWAVNMGKPPEYDPISETEYLLKGTLADAEIDGTLGQVASTYKPQDDRVVVGIGSKGPRIITFAPLLEMNTLPINSLLVKLTDLCEEAVGSDVEIEFAVTFDPSQNLPARFGFLQVRPMVVSQDQVEVTTEEMDGENVLIAADKVLGNGNIETLQDIVYVKPDVFEAKNTKKIAVELSEINRKITSERRSYILIGFGRFGSSDPWLGIPVEWGQISGVKVIVESTLPDMDVELSQGSHFFHNLISFKVFYFSVRHSGRYHINWEWFDKQKEVIETEHVRHIKLSKPVDVKVDGRCGQGVIRL